MIVTPNGHIYISPEMLEKAEKNGISRKVLIVRLARDWTEEEATTLLVGSHRNWMGI